jgi:hypothetical protein
MIIAASIEKKRAKRDINLKMRQYCLPKGPVRFIIYLYENIYLAMSAGVYL